MFFELERLTTERGGTIDSRKSQTPLRVSSSFEISSSDESSRVSSSFEFLPSRESSFLRFLRLMNQNEVARLAAENRKLLQELERLKRQVESDQVLCVLFDLLIFV